MKRWIIAVAMIAAPPSALSIDVLEGGSAFGDFENCAHKQAARFASLGGSITELATAAIGACEQERQAFRNSQLEHYRSRGTSYGLALELADGVTSDIVDQLKPELMGIIAEHRLR